MQFQLPSNLQNELIAYDPVLKKLAREQKQQQQQNTESKSSKTKYPVGKPPCLIPSSVVRASDLEEAIDGINSRSAPVRYHQFRRATGEFPNLDYETRAIVYHWEGLWVAAWLPPKGKENEYVYGYTYCYKDLPSVRKKLRYGVATDCSFIREDVNRSSYMIKSVHVTKQMIIDGNTDRHWQQCNLYGQKGRRMGEVVRAFEKSLANSVPSWSDGVNIFDRLQDGLTPFKIVFGDNYPKTEIDSYFSKCFERYGMTRETWTLNVDTFFTFFDTVTHNNISRVRDTLDKPFFRKFIQTKCEEINLKFNDSSNKSRKAVRAPYLQIDALADSIQYIRNIWPDTPIDYFQSNIDVLIGTRHVYGPWYKVADWLRQNMQVASYFHIRTKFYLESMKEVQENEHQHNYNFDSSLGLIRFPFREWDDTINMLKTVLEANRELEAPKRWRLTEFHDHVQSEAWKIKNPNQALPQDLFPSPVKIELDDKTWTFFQPIDTHQLSQWGQAVRNCVGNASNYAEGIRKKEHFIVLCMIDNKPTFTVQLEVRMSLLSVRQIVAVANRRLSPDESDSYTRAFGKALQAQEDRLKSGATSAPGNA